jgi:hypothetical protein
MGRVSGRRRMRAGWDAMSGSSLPAVRRAILAARPTKYAPRQERTRIGREEHTLGRIFNRGEGAPTWGAAGRPAEGASR